MMRISCEGRKLILTLEPADDDYTTFENLFEPYASNGSFTLFDASDANPFVGLWGGECIAESLDIDEDGNRTIIGRLWAFMDYAIRDPFDELQRTGRVAFTLV